jgi:hypothetical protein
VLVPKARPRPDAAQGDAQDRQTDAQDAEGSPPRDGRRPSERRPPDLSTTTRNAAQRGPGQPTGGQMDRQTKARAAWPDERMPERLLRPVLERPSVILGRQPHSWEEEQAVPVPDRQTEEQAAPGGSLDSEDPPSAGRALCGGSDGTAAVAGRLGRGVAGQADTRRPSWGAELERKVCEGRRAGRQTGVKTDSCTH